jgi:hypothetical protein
MVLSSLSFNYEAQYKLFLTLVIMTFTVHITAVTTRTDSPNIHHPYLDIS